MNMTFHFGRMFSLALFVCSATASVALFAADGVDTRPLPLKTVRAFPNIKPRRPVAITNAADGTNRLFTGSESGHPLFIPNDQNVTDTKTFLDIEPKVDYEYKENEEGLLGLAF